MPKGIATKKVISGTHQLNTKKAFMNIPNDAIFPILEMLKKEVLSETVTFNLLLD